MHWLVYHYKDVNKRTILDIGSFLICYFSKYSHDQFHFKNDFDQIMLL